MTSLGRSRLLVPDLGSTSGWPTIRFGWAFPPILDSIRLACMTGTSKATIISRTENMGEPAITSWGEQACIRALRLDGDKNFCILDYHAPAGFGPPRHLHYVQDEVLEILEGSIAVWTPDWCGVLHAGDIVSLAAGVPHAWRSIDDLAVHFTIVVTPGGPGGFKEFFPTINGTSPLRMFLSLLPLLKSVECRSPALPSLTQRLRG